MIVALNYTFHDCEPNQLVVDTDKLDVNHIFEKAVKEALESKKKSIQLMGEEFDDDFSEFDQAKVKPPVKIDSIKNLHVYFDC